MGFTVSRILTDPFSLSFKHFKVLQPTKYIVRHVIPSLYLILSSCEHMRIPNKNKYPDRSYSASISLSYSFPLPTALSTGIYLLS